MYLRVPMKIYIEPTNNCNLKCKLCFQSENNGMTRRKGYMGFGLYKKIINQIRSFGSEIALHLAGEPLLHPDISNFIRFARANGLKAKISTNGKLLSNDDFEILYSGMGELEISFMAVSKEDYIDLRNYDGFEGLITVLEYIANEKCKKNLDFILNVSGIMTEQNQDSCSTFFERISKIRGVDNVFLKSVWNWIGIIDPSDKRLTNPNLKDKRLKQILESKRKAYEMTVRGLNEGQLMCTNPFRSIAICWDGEVVPCCMDIDKKYPLGNIKHDKILDIWNGELMNDIREALRSKTETLKHPLCGKCKG